MIDEEILAGVQEIRERLRLLERQDSITVSKGMAGKYAWDIKVHGRLETQDQQDAALSRIHSINEELKKKFGGEQA